MRVPSWFVLLMPLCLIGQQQGPLRNQIPEARQIPARPIPAGQAPAGQNPGSRAPHPDLAAPERTGDFARQDQRPLHKRADAIVVARTVGGTATPEQGAVAYDVRIQVIRALAGSGITPGQELHLVFRDDRPRFPLPSAQPVELSTGIVFLARRGETFEPLRQPIAPRPTGGFLLHLPEATAPTKDAADVPMRIGLELAAALEHWGANHGQALDVAGGERGLTTLPSRSREAVYFEQAASYFLGPVSDPAPYASLYPEFLRSASPHVRMVGIQGMIRLQQPMGLQILARELPLYLRSVGAVMLHESLRRFDVSKHPGTVDAMGSIALSEQASAGVESAASWALGQHALVDSMPYFATLLESPHPNTRAGALMGICNLHSGPNPRAALMHYSGDEARPHCPQRYPVTDPNAERAHVAFWRDWWNENCERIEKDFRGDGTGKVLPFVRPVAPVRWVDARQPVSRVRQASPEQAARSILRMFDPNNTSFGHVRVSDADRVRGMLRINADDRDIALLVEELRRGAIALRVVDEELRAARSQQQLAGQRPDPSLAQQAEERAAGVVRDFLREVQQRISPDAFQSLQASIQQRAKDTVSISLPAPRPAP